MTLRFFCGLAGNNGQIANSLVRLRLKLAVDGFKVLNVVLLSCIFD